MNNFEYKCDDDMTSVDSVANYSAQIRRNKARDVELKEQLRVMDESKDQEFQEQPFPATILKYTVMSNASDNSMNSTVVVMLAWLEEKDNENKRLKDQVQQLQAALSQKEIALAAFRERLANQEKLLENELKMKKLKLNEEKVNKVITKVVDVPALDCKSWDQDDKNSSKSSKSIASIPSTRLFDAYGDSGKYTGNILQLTGMPHGVGRLEYDDKDKTYDGDWSHGRWHGSGKATFLNGDSYEGEYRRDQRHGRGRFVWSDGRMYEGEFQDDKEQGKGMMVWPNGSKYIGEFQNGKQEGKGHYSFPGGGYYSGNWKNNCYDGYGERHWEDGRSYRGEWRMGKAHGQGVETLQDGQIRNDGSWIEGKPVR